MFCFIVGHLVSFFVLSFLVIVGQHIRLIDGRQGIVRIKDDGMVGILLDEGFRGDSDGSIHGSRYFLADPKRAVFVSDQEIFLVPMADKDDQNIIRLKTQSKFFNRHLVEI